MVAALKIEGRNLDAAYEAGVSHLRARLKDCNDEHVWMLVEHCLDRELGLAAFAYLHELHLREMERTQ